MPNALMLHTRRVSRMRLLALYVMLAIVMLISLLGREDVFAHLQTSDLGWWAHLR